MKANEENTWILQHLEQWIYRLLIFKHLTC